MDVSPDRQRSLVRESWPFGVVTLVAECSLLLEPSLVVESHALASVGLFALSAGVLLSRRRWLPRWANLAIPLLYVVGALELVVSSEHSSLGLGLIVFLPLLWSALYLTIWESFVVLLGVALVQIDVSFVTTATTVATTTDSNLRHLGTYVFVGALALYSIHELRRRITRLDRVRDELTHQMTLSIRVLEESNRSTLLLKTLGDRLLRCETKSQALNEIERTGGELFRGAGALSLREDGSEEFRRVCNWGDATERARTFRADECRGVTTDRPYVSGRGSARCAHLGSDTKVALCCPVYVDGRTAGLVSVDVVTIDDRVSDADSIERVETYVALLSDQIGMWITSFTLREALKEMVIRDPLTNLFNRRFMEESLTRELRATQREGAETCVVQIDVDNFKRFNDVYGHDVGDEVLRGVAAAISELFRGSDVPCRSGGEEFTVILSKCPVLDAQARAVQLQRRIANLLVDAPLVGVLAPPTISVGIAGTREHGFDAGELLRAADQALYVAKARGRNQIALSSAVA